MAKNTCKPKAIDKISLPAVNISPSTTTLPYNGSVVKDTGFSFSFACFDRTHGLFNLGDRSEKSGVVSGAWFLDLLDCLKNIGGMSVSQVVNSMYDMHRVDWKRANVSAPPGSDQAEYWQIRINKSRGRIIGILLEGVFYIVWLDPHHNLTDSPHYETATKHPSPKSEYEIREEEISRLKCKLEQVSADYQAAQQLLDEKTI